MSSPPSHWTAMEFIDGEPVVAREITYTAPVPQDTSTGPFLALNLVPVRSVLAGLQRDHPDHPITLALAAGVHAFGTLAQGNARTTPTLTIRTVACHIRKTERGQVALADDRARVYCEQLAEPIEFHLTMAELDPGKERLLRLADRDKLKRPVTAGAWQEFRGVPRR